MNQQEYNQELKKTISKYITSTMWYLLNAGDQDIPLEAFMTMAQRIEESETRLRELGVFQKAIDKLLNFVKKSTSTPISELSKGAQLRICKLIFGERAKWAN